MDVSRYKTADRVRPRYEYDVTVIKHVDGDTSHVRVHASTDAGFDVTIGIDINLTVRWNGINAPEISTPEGKDALAWLEKTLPAGSSCVMRSVKDKKEKYGRYLGTFFAVVSDEGYVNLNQAMIDAGHAVSYEGGKR